MRTIWAVAGLGKPNWCGSSLEVQEGAALPAHGNQRSGREAQPEWIA